MNQGGKKKTAHNNNSSCYKHGKVTFFHSVKEENEKAYYEYACNSPEESLSKVTAMRVSAYPYLNKTKNPWGKIIYFNE